MVPRDLAGVTHVRQAELRVLLVAPALLALPVLVDVVRQAAVAIAVQIVEKRPLEK